MPVVPGAQQGVAKLRQIGFDLVVVTSRQFVIQDQTRQWLDRNFPKGTFSQVVFGNHWGLEGPKIPKVDICLQLGAVLLVDDALKYVNEIASAGIDALLFDLHGEYPWNTVDGHLPDRITRVHDWTSVVDYVQKNTLALADRQPSSAQHPCSEN